ncbi:MAG: GDSL-type esterase/lipase family protein [Parcubacteria group bacterium]|jgi:lysophospholipase L1-like esterase/ADP-ribose pyrophosphatase YjhB (NUDIX family)
MKRICIFGDSITWAMGLPKRVGWADLLRNYLEAETDYYLEIYNLGIDRNTSADLLKRIESESEARKPDMIIILIGTNDSLQYMRDGELVDQASPDVFQDNLQKLVNRARKITTEIFFIGLALGDELLTNPLPKSVTGKRYTKARISAYDKIIKDVAGKNSLPFVDISSTLDNEDFIDGLHPSEIGHKKIYQRLIEVMGSYLFERNVIVNEDDNVIGVKNRSDIKTSDIYRVSCLWLRNSKKEVLLTQRSLSKRNDPGLWGPAVAGTVAENETYESNIIKENKEELDLSEMALVLGPKKLIEGERKFYNQVFYGLIDREAEEFILQKDEIEQVAWFNEEDLLSEVAKNPEKFISSMPTLMEMIYKINT